MCLCSEFVIAIFKNKNFRSQCNGFGRGAVGAVAGNLTISCPESASVHTLVFGPIQHHNCTGNMHPPTSHYNSIRFASACSSTRPVRKMP